MFAVKFCFIFSGIKVRNRLNTFKNIPKYIYEINIQTQTTKKYLKSYHDHCFSRSYIQNKRPGPSFACSKKVSALWITEYFAKRVSYIVVSLPITFAVCKFGRWRELQNKFADFDIDQRITVNIEIAKFLRNACDVCIFKYFTLILNARSSLRRLEQDWRV